MPADVYRRLQQHLDRAPVPFPRTESGVELRILERLFSREEAEVALALSMAPEPAATIRKRLQGDWPEEHVTTLLDQMAAKGLIERGHGRGKPRYSKSIFAVGIYERQLQTLDADLLRDVEAYFEQGFGKAFHSSRPQQMRIVPVETKLTLDRTVASFDDIRSFVAATDGPFAIMECICRKGKDLLGDPCHQTSLRDTCLTFGPAAEGMVAGGAARFVEREETMAVIDAADREGLVLQPQNTIQPWFVCCCCGCCCGVLRSGRELAEPAAAFHSNYLAVCDPDLCSGCALCETRCQMDAVHVDGSVCQVDEVRCIGCGLCATTCSAGAMRLVAKEDSSPPQRSTPSLYLQMYRERYGTFELAKALGKALVGRKI